MKTNLKTFPDLSTWIEDEDAFIDMCVEWKEDFEAELRELNNPVKHPRNGDAVIRIKEVLGE